MIGADSLLATILNIFLAARFYAQGHDAASDPPPLRGYNCKPNAQRPCELCPAGNYCPSKFEKLPCGAANVYCKIGSVLPTQVADGHYTINGDEEHRSDERICEAGFFCEGGIKKICPAGFFCPNNGMKSPLECGDASRFCNEGSSQPQLVAQGYYSIGDSNERKFQQEIAPLGHYAKDGILNECPEGHYGDTEGLSDDHCSGVCEAGWFCPVASISSRQIACGGEDFYCPRGSSSPKKVQHGYYTTKEWEPCRPGMYRDEPENDPSDLLSSVNQTREIGRCVLCPEGTFKTSQSDSIDACVPCGPKAKSTSDRVTCECHQSATQRQTLKLYFDVGSKTCIDVTNHTSLPPDTMYQPDSQLTKSGQRKCKPGSYCIEGVRFLCPAGRYGDKAGEKDSECTGPCKAGHFCPLGSSSPTQIECGDKPNVYCPESSDVPTYVSEKYYASEEDSPTKKTSQELCPPGYYCPGDGLRHKCLAGHYGINTGLTNPTCDGRCDAGYYCPAGSTLSHQIPCGNVTVICAEGSSEPQPVLRGYYSVSSSETQRGEVRYAGPNSTQDITLECEIAHFCKEGVKYQCPGGTYGSKEGAGDVSECQICPPGHYCPSYPGPPTTHETIIRCGESYLYCPQGSPEPKDVDTGHYSISNEIDPGQAHDESLEYSDRRTGQVVCPPGYYCKLGVRHKCPPGTYGEKPGQTECEICPRGFFCPLNTVNPLPCSPGAYSSGGAAECTSCEIPLTVGQEKKNRMCRDDRECCFSVFEESK